MSRSNRGIGSAFLAGLILAVMAFALHFQAGVTSAAKQAPQECGQPVWHGGLGSTHTGVMLYGVANLDSVNSIAVGRYLDNGVEVSYSGLITDGSSITEKTVDHFGGVGNERLVGAYAYTGGATAAGNNQSASTNHYTPFTSTFDGNQWTNHSMPVPAGSVSNHLFGISGTSASDMWVVGLTDYITGTVALTEHWNGSAWTIVPSSNLGLAAQLAGVTAYAPNDVWAAGFISQPTPNQPLIAHWDGVTWSAATLPHQATDTMLNGIGGALNDIYAVGMYDADGGGSLKQFALHKVGNTWVVVNLDVSGQHYASALQAAADQDGTTIVVGMNDTDEAGTQRGEVLTSNGTSLSHYAWYTATLQSPLYGLTTTSSTLKVVGGVGVESLGLVGYSTCSGPASTPTPTVPAGTPTETNTPNPNATATNTVEPSATVTSQPEETHTPAPPSATRTSVPPTVTATATWTPEPPTPCTGFSDVQPNDYFYQPVMYLWRGDVVSGYADCTFHPYAETTRSQLAKLVVLGFNKPIQTPANGNYTFADVPPSHPFFTYVETEAALGVVSGYMCGGPGEPCDNQQRRYFHPYASVTRAQIVKVIVLTAGWQYVTPATYTFADVLPSNPFYNFVETAYAHHIIVGYACPLPGDPCDDHNRPYFRPGGNAMRGQISKIVYLALVDLNKIQR